MCPFIEILSAVGLNPTIPVQAAGHLIEPPISDPIPTGLHLAATIPASPPEEPAHVLFLSQGF